MLLKRVAVILLSLGCIVSASVCIWKLAVKEPTLDNSKRNIPGSTTNRSQDHNADIQHHLDRHQSQLLLSTQITAGWIIFTSIIVLLYQLFSVLQNLIISGLFCVSAIFLKIPGFVVNAAFITAYTPASIAMAVFTYQWTVPIVSNPMLAAHDQSHYHDQQLNRSEYENQASQYTFNFLLPVIFTCVFAFVSTLYFIVMMVLSILAKTIWRKQLTSKLEAATRAHGKV